MENPLLAKFLMQQDGRHCYYYYYYYHWDNVAVLWVNSRGWLEFFKFFSEHHLACVLSHWLIYSQVFCCFHHLAHITSNYNINDITEQNAQNKQKKSELSNCCREWWRHLGNTTASYKGMIITAASTDYFTRRLVVDHLVDQLPLLK